MSDELDIRVIRSARRTKTISGQLLNWNTLEVRAPAGMSDEELAPIINRLVEQVLRKRGAGHPSNADLQHRAEKLNKRHFGNKLHWRSIRFVSNQRRRFGSCSPGEGTIRISDRLAQVPDFVLDYVIMHELAHLAEANHSRAFWDLVYCYKLSERARGYLMALQIEDDTLEGEDTLPDQATDHDTNTREGGE
jgi:hypothetical protein